MFSVALQNRGTPAGTAHLTADAGIAVFKAAYARWVEEPEQREFAHLVGRALEELRTVTGDG